MEQALKTKFINSFKDPFVREKMFDKIHLLDKLEHSQDEIIHSYIERHNGKDTWTFILKDKSEIKIEE